MADTEFLTVAEIRQLTGKAKSRDQTAKLDELGVPYRDDSGRLLVNRHLVRLWSRGEELPRSRGPKLSMVR